MGAQNAFISLNGNWNPITAEWFYNQDGHSSKLQFLGGKTLLRYFGNGTAGTASTTWYTILSTNENRQVAINKAAVDNTNPNLVVDIRQSLYTDKQFQDSGLTNPTLVGITTVGNVGIGTTNPSEKLDVFGDISIGTAGTAIARITRKNSNSVIVIGGGASGYQSTGANIELYGSTHSLYAGEAYHDAVVHTFRNNFEEGTIPTVYVSISTSTSYFNNSIGIGTINPSSTLHVQGNAYITGVTTSTDFNTTSDFNLKTNIHQIDNSLSKVIQIRGVTFDWKDTNRSSAGVIAQEVEKVLPELVNGEEIKTVNYNGITGVLIESIKELKAENDIMKKRLDEVYKKVFG